MRKIFHRSGKKAENPRMRRLALFGVSSVIVFVLLAYAAGYADLFRTAYHWSAAEADTFQGKNDPPPPPALDKKAYNAKLLALAHINMASTTLDVSTTTPKGMTLIIPGTATTSVSAAHKLWPVATVYPNAGALLPFKRIVAYYGNFYSTHMGVLGEYPAAEMLAKLKGEVAAWEAADPATPVIPAIHYIVETAQGSAGKDGKYRLRMPDTQIDHALELAKEVNGIVFLDFQVGLSDLPAELPIYEEYLKKPDVHLAIDPEFSMKDGVRPGKEIGTFDATDINYAANYLAKLVRENGLPPKILVIHRFTEDMVTGYKRITPLPEVEIVMDMDGWGFAAKKINTYQQVIYSEPVQFTGFKLFYKNDVKPPSTRMLTPSEVLSLTPAPLYIQYQ